MKGVQYLYGTIFPDQMDIPSFVINYDIEVRNTWSHDHKLRKFLSLKLDFEYLNFYWTHCFNNLQM